MSPDEVLRRGRIGRWRVVRLIGEGGFSFVFEVEDPNSHKRLALKMLRPEAAKGEEYRRFWKEATLLAAQNDQHLVAVMMLDRDEELGVDYYVMELLTGRTLAQLLKAEGELSTARAVDIFLGALRGLAKLQTARKPVIHRDIKPANIQIAGDGRAKILDLGIATTLGDRGDDTVSGADEDFTTADTYKGTPRYSSPEQLQVLPLDLSSDLFSLGIALFESLEGCHPYCFDQPDLPTSINYQVALGFHARLEAGRKEGLSLEFRRTPKPIQAVVRRALSLRPQDRYRNAAEMGRALAAAAQGREEGPAPRRPSSPSQSWVRLAAGATGLALVLVAGIGVYVMFGGDGGGGESQPTRKPRPTETVEPPRLDKPTAMQEQVRAEAGQVVAEVERLRSEGRVDADAAKRVIEAQREGDDDWAARRFADAERRYRAAKSEGIQVIDHAQREEFAQRNQEAEQSRAAADEMNADENAPTEWTRAEDLMRQARGAAAKDSGPLYASARDAYEAARAQAEKALGGAQAKEKDALAARARLPGKGDCGAIDEPKARKACGTGASALTDGSAALAAKDAPSALKSFEVAKRSFEQARPVTAPPVPINKPPTLSLDPSGSLALVVGQSKTIRAHAQDPERKEPTVEFTVQKPDGVRIKSKGKALRFEPEREGEYTIEAVAIDPEGAASSPARLFASVREPDKNGDLAAEVRETLREFVDAISTCDVDALKVVYPRSVEDIGSFVRDCKLAASINPVGEPEWDGRQARQKINRSIRLLGEGGRHLVLAEGPAVASLSKRRDGWYIDSME